MKIVFFTSFPAYNLVNRTVGKIYFFDKIFTSLYSGQQLNILLIQVNKAGLQFRKLKANFGIAKEGALQVSFILVLDFGIALVLWYRLLVLVLPKWIPPWCLKRFGFGIGLYRQRGGLAGDFYWCWILVFPNFGF